MGPGTPWFGHSGAGSASVRIAGLPALSSARGLCIVNGRVKGAGCAT